jgi:hypothetical protein
LILAEVAMSLLDKYLPVYQFSERHSIVVDGAAGAVLDAVQAYDPAADPVSRRLTVLRELPGRLMTKLGFAGTSRPAIFGMDTFIPLDRDGDRAMVAGLVGRFWRLDYGLVPLQDAAAFLAFAEPGTAKLVIGFLAEPQGEKTRLVTETRVHCPDRRSLLLFTPYWVVIRLASGLIRRRFLQGIKRGIEHRPITARTGQGQT